MRNVKWVFILVVALSGLLMAAQRASMTAPVVKSEPEQIQVSASFSQFTAGSEYRLGVGASSELSGFEIHLEKDGTDIGGSPSGFSQPQSWWSEAGELKALGFLLQDSQLPEGDATLSLRITVTRSAADAAGSFYIFVAKRYGPNTWYLEDGAELNKQYW